MAEIIKLGSLYLDDVPARIGTEYDGEDLLIGDTLFGKELSFIRWGKLLVADNCVCVNISWNDLYHMGFIFGRPIMIDGKPYKCRSLQAGALQETQNEWDSILDELSADNELWHWKGCFFWGQEIYRNQAVYRGGHSARFWSSLIASYQSDDFGFRPVLEPLFLDPSTHSPDNLIGSRLKIYGPAGGIVSGRLTDVTEYDLTVHDAVIESPSKGGVWYVCQPDGTITINKDLVACMNLDDNYI